ncbi:MAG: DUF4397 domain-containing protein [Chloroflexota bacterium]
MPTKLSRLGTVVVAAAVLAILAGPVAAASRSRLTAIVAGPVATASRAPLTAIIAVDSTDAPASGFAWVRVLHASPDAPAVDVKVNDANALTHVAFGTISAYLPVAAGDYNIKVCPAGTTTCVINADLTFADGVKYTVAATNLLASIEAQVITDGAVLDAANAQVRVVHFSSDTPAIDVRTQDGTSTIVPNLSYPSATGYLTLPANTYDLKVCAHAANCVCPFDRAPLTIATGTAYSVFAIGALTRAPTPPPTSTDITSNPTASNSIGLSAALIGAGLITLLGAVRLATHRVER